MTSWPVGSGPESSPKAARRGCRLLVCVLGLCLLAACGSGGQLTVSYTAPIAPISISASVDDQGHVSASVDVNAKLTTPLGTFSAAAGKTEELGRNADGLVVAFRGGATGAQQDVDYEVLSGRVLHFELNGHAIGSVAPHLLVITLDPGTAYRLWITDDDPKATPASPSPRPDAGCEGSTHRERLPALSIGRDGSDTVDSVSRKLRSMCLNFEVHVVHAEDDGELVTTGTPAPAGAIERVSFATGKALWGLGSWQWCEYSYDNEWRWRVPANNFGAGFHTLHDGEIVTADSGRAAVVYVADGRPGPPWLGQ